MTKPRYRLVFTVRDELVEREVALEGQEPVKALLNWLADEYEERAKMKKIYVLGADGSEEQIFK